MQTTGFRLIIRFLIVNIFYSVLYLPFYPQLLVAEDKTEDKRESSSSGDRRQNWTVANDKELIEFQKLSDMSTCPIEVPKDSKVKKLYEACIAKEKREQCSDAMSGYEDMKSAVADGCKGSGLSGSECIDRARACVGAQSANPMQSLIGVSVASNICGTKEEKERAQDLEKDQAQDMKDTQEDMSERYRDAQQQYNEAQSQMYDTLMQISGKNKEMKDLGVNVPHDVQATERKMRRQFMASREEYSSKQEQLVLINKEILRTNTKMGELPNGFMEACQKQYRDDYEEAKLTQVQLSKSLQSGLKEVSSSSTIQSYDLGLKEAKKEYDLAKKSLENKIKNRYMDCLSAKQKEYKAKREELERQLEGQNASKRALEKNLESHLVSMNADLEEGRSDIKRQLDLAQNQQTASQEEIDLVRAQYNTTLNAAQQGVVSAAQEMQSFQQQSQQQQQFKMMSGMMGMLTTSGQGSLGDVVPYIEEYDNYMADKDSLGCVPKSRSSGGYEGRSSK
jgi:hypothetical protein